MAHEQAQAAQFKLPVLVFGVVEVRRLQRELEALEEFVRQSQLREPGQQGRLPRVSRLLDALATDNGLQLLQPDHRQQILQFLKWIETQAPTVHMSFAIDPSSSFTSKMVTWWRANVHPFMLLDVGLQPTIALGCVVRTQNKVFDFSLRQRFADTQGMLIQAFDTMAGEGQPATVTTATALADPQLAAVAAQAQALASSSAAEASAVAAASGPAVPTEASA